MCRASSPLHRGGIAFSPESWGDARACLRKTSRSAERIVQAFNDGDVEAALAEMHPDVEFIPRRAPVQGSFRGHKGIREFFADNAESFDVFHVTTDEAAEITVTASSGSSTLRVRGKGERRGGRLSPRQAVVLTFVQGKARAGSRSSASEHGPSKQRGVGE